MAALSQRPGSLCSVLLETDLPERALLPRREGCAGGTAVSACAGGRQAGSSSCERQARAARLSALPASPLHPVLQFFPCCAQHTRGLRTMLSSARLQAWGLSGSFIPQPSARFWHPGSRQGTGAACPWSQGLSGKLVSACLGCSCPGRLSVSWSSSWATDCPAHPMLALGTCRSAEAHRNTLQHQGSAVPWQCRIRQQLVHWIRQQWVHWIWQ